MNQRKILTGAAALALLVVVLGGVLHRDPKPPKVILRGNMGGQIGGGFVPPTKMGSGGGGTGDITDVVAGSGLTGGAASGAATVDVGCGTGLSCAADTIGIASGGVGTTELADNLDLSANGSTTLGDQRGNVASVAVSGNLTDWNPAGLSTANVLRIDPTGGVNLFSMAGGANGREVTLLNASAAGALTIYDEYLTGTTASMRFECGGLASISLTAGMSVTVVYDVTTARWRPKNLQNQYEALVTTGSFVASQVFGVYTALRWINYFGSAQWSVVSPASISGAQNNYAPTDLNNSMVGRLDPTAAASITGITAGRTGRILVLQNVGTGGFAITLTHEDAASTAANRFLTPGGVNYVIATGASVLLVYDAVAARWRVVDAQVGRVPALGLLDTTTAPTFGACGTTPTATTGGAYASTITMGSGTATTCAVTFSTTYTNAPTCQVTSRSSARQDVYLSAVSTSGVTISNVAAANMASIVVDLICVGH